MTGLITRDDLRWTLPFGVFLLCLGLLPMLGLPWFAAEAVRWAAVGGAVWFVSRPVLDFRAPHWLGSVAIGVLVFLAWIVPDLLWPGYREGPLFSNSLLGHPRGAFPETLQSNVAALAIRSLRAALLVPIVEELFWRGWLPRWIVGHHHVESVPLGTFTRAAFWITAVLFAVEHGSWWDVGLVAGVIYNWWMIRTRSLGDLILAHAVTNACLSGYVIWSGQWQYW